MAEAQVDRGVLYTLRVEADQGAETVLKEFGQKVSRVQQTLDQSAIQAARQRAQKTGQAISGAYRESTQARESVHQQATQRELQREQGLTRGLKDELQNAPRPNKLQSVAVKKLLMRRIGKPSQR